MSAVALKQTRIAAAHLRGSDPLAAEEGSMIPVTRFTSGGAGG